MPKKILVVDDEPDLVSMLKARLEANNYEVATAFDGEEGLSKAKKEKPDLIVLDIMMPKMDGMMLAEALKQGKETADIPIIFLTCLAEGIETKSRASKIGNNIFVGKPFDASELLSMVNQVMNVK